MTTRRFLSTFLLLTCAISIAGCCSARRRAASPIFPRRSSCSTCDKTEPRPSWLNRLDPRRPQPVAPAPFLPSTPPSQPPATIAPQPSFPTAPPPSFQAEPENPPLSRKFEWQPSPPSSSTGEPPRVRLQAPERFSDPRVDIPKPVVPEPATPDPVVPTPAPDVPEPEGTENPPPPAFGDPPSHPVIPEETESPETPSPVILPQFAIVKENISTGQKPFLDGVDWLKKKGYRTILYLHKPGEDTSAEKQYFTNQGFRFESLAVSPTTLTKQTALQFNAIINESTNQPIYVFHDGASYLAGGMWYLYHRLNEGTIEATAAEEAKRLGLKPEQDSYHRAMWNAVRQLLSP